MEQQFVIIRTDSAGVHMGYLKSEEKVNGFYAVELVNTRRIWSWDGANCLSNLAIYGSKKPENCRISGVLPSNKLMAIEIILVTDKGKANLEAIPEWSYNG